MKSMNEVAKSASFVESFYGEYRDNLSMLGKVDFYKIKPYDLMVEIYQIMGVHLGDNAHYQDYCLDVQRNGDKNHHVWMKEYPHIPKLYVAFGDLRYESILDGESWIKDRRHILGLYNLNFPEGDDCAPSSEYDRNRAIYEAYSYLNSKANFPLIRSVGKNFIDMYCRLCQAEYVNDMLVDNCHIYESESDVAKTIFGNRWLQESFGILWNSTKPGNNYKTYVPYIKGLVKFRAKCVENVVWGKFPYVDCKEKKIKPNDLIGSDY